MRLFMTFMDLLKKKLQTKYMKILLYFLNIKRNGNTITNICLNISGNIMKKLLLLLMPFLISALIFSCKSTSESTVEEIDFFPLDSGNDWIFKTYNIGQDSVMIAGTEVQDSLVIIGTKEILGHLAYIFQFSRKNDTVYVPIDTIYFYKEGKSVFQILNEKNTSIPQQGDFWYKIAEFIDNFDNSYHTSLPNYDILFNSTSVSSVADFIINSRYEYSERIPVLGSSLPSRLFVLKNDRRFTFKYKFADTVITLKRTQLMRQRIWFGEFTGISQIIYDPYYIKTAPDSVSDYKYYQPEYKYFNGSKSELLRMSVK
jgi:hypothetical protein